MTSVLPADDGAYFQQMGQLVNNKQHSDIKFEMDGKTVYAHKAILAMRSPFFMKMFDLKRKVQINIKSSFIVLFYLLLLIHSITALNLILGILTILSNLDTINSTRFVRFLKKKICCVIAVFPFFFKISL